MNIIKKVFRKDNSGAFSLGILAFEGFGIRLLDNILPSPILWWTGVLLLLNFHYVIKAGTQYWVRFSFIIVFFILFNFVKGITPPLFMVAAWLSASFVISRYIYSKEFISDLRKLCKFSMYYHLIHIPFMPFAKAFPLYSFGIDYYSLYGVLWYVANSGEYLEFPRICCFAWEPSCWNLMINLNLTFVLYFKENRKIMLLSFIVLLSTFSTTALVTMVGILGLYYFQQVGTKGYLKNIFIGIILLSIIAPIAYKDLSNKMETGSGQARGGDFIIAKAVLERSPWLGEDLANVSKLSYAIKARQEYWTAGTDGNQDMCAGMTNGFAGLLVEWGLVIGIYIFYLTYKTSLIFDAKLKRLYLLTISMVIMGSPISMTGFFYLCSLSTLLISPKAQRLCSLSNSYS